MATVTTCVRTDCCGSKSIMAYQFVSAMNTHMPCLHTAVTPRIVARRVQVDLIIVDFGVNDAVIEEFEYNLEYLRMAHEILIRHVRDTMNHSPALLYAESFIAPFRSLESPWQGENMAEVHASVTQKHDIPMVSLVSPLRGFCKRLGSKCCGRVSEQSTFWRCR